MARWVVLRVAGLIANAMFTRAIMFGVLLHFLNTVFKKASFAHISDPTELDSPDQPGSHIRMKQSTLQKIYKAQKQLGYLLNFTSGVRSEAHNQKVGGVSNSAHLNGWAVDVDTRGKNLEQIANVLYDVGFRRFGIGQNAIHVDDDPTKPSPALWYFNNGSISQNSKIYKLVHGS